MNAATKNFILAALNLAGILLIIVGIFGIAGTFAGKSVNFGALKIGDNATTAFFFVILGLILFAASAILTKISRK